MFGRYIPTSAGKQTNKQRSADVSVLSVPSSPPRPPEPLTLDVQLLGLVHQRHHVLGFGGDGLEPAQTSQRLLGLLLRSRVSQEVVEVLGQVVGLWRGGDGGRRRRRWREKRMKEKLHHRSSDIKNLLRCLTESSLIDQ